MLKLVLSVLAATTLFAASAQAEEFRIGAGTISGDYDHGTDSPYFDTYPGQFCGVQAVRIAVMDRNNGGTVRIGRVYFAWETPGEKGPFRAYAKVNTVLHEGESTGWIRLPNYGCLKKVRVYAEGNMWPDDYSSGRARVVVIGTR